MLTRNSCWYVLPIANTPCVFQIAKGSRKISIKSILYTPIYFKISRFQRQGCFLYVLVFKFYCTINWLKAFTISLIHTIIFKYPNQFRINIITIAIFFVLKSLDTYNSYSCIIYPVTVVKMQKDTIHPLWQIYQHLWIGGGLFYEIFML